MSIKEAQELVDRWIREYGVRYFSELTNMTVLTEEVGEDLTQELEKSIEKKTQRDSLRHIHNKKLMA